MSINTRLLICRLLTVRAACGERLSHVNRLVGLEMRLVWGWIGDDW